MVIDEDCREHRGAQNQRGGVSVGQPQLSRRHGACDTWYRALRAVPATDHLHAERSQIPDT